MPEKISKENLIILEKILPTSNNEDLPSHENILNL